MKYIARFLKTAAIGAGAAALVILVGVGSSSAGIEGSGRRLVAYGRITAFGSIFVDGVEFSISQAKIAVDGRPGSASQLQIGQIVSVQADTTGPAKAKASNVTYIGDVVGPISGVDLAAGTFTVLGQAVKVDGATLYGDGMPSSGLQGLALGTHVEVSAFVNASGELMASRVDLQIAGAPLQVNGAVEDLNTQTKAFHINALTIDYSQATVDGNLANAGTATVWADEYPSAGTLHATRVQVSAGMGGSNGDEGKLEGLVTSVNSNGAFYVGEQLVLTDAKTMFALHGHALAPNLPVKVHGAFDASGALLAKMVSADK
jgi:hypothetical protein